MLDVDISLRRGSFQLQTAFAAPVGITAVFGPSGSGKTTLIDAIAGLIRPDAGRIDLRDTRLFDSAKTINISTQNRQIGYVFQDSRLFPHMSVRKNLLYSTKFGRVPSLDFDHIVDLLGLAAFLDRRPKGLSGGEKQRVAIGRALLSAPKLLLLDEPLSALDRNRRDSILPYIEKMRDDLNLPILYVSHDVSEITRLADMLVLINDGVCLAQGRTEDLMSDPALLPYFGLHQGGSVLIAKIVRHHIDGLTELATDAGSLFVPRIDAVIGTFQRLQIKASDIILSNKPMLGTSALNNLQGVIEDIHMGDGPGVAVAVRCNDIRLIARLTKRSLSSLGFSVGSQCYATFKSTAITATGRAGRR
ncbi:molybdenum ABC transporter ATP-binding protein [Parasulfitobacter algicola]|uniref:Molybdenum ABC transporter ATP-binding protein n=1 Tax=Parasulfitobacter algicola TaxID=2614809 RepID=A0ABX2ITW4_9RHOB|nr:molybdenum ABC transporter ATP-binding protein [Sulfitobacter algicola]NSX56341.1 molybdenum ABC transporter ATP-binding protein [Sulfitobacter algicola]